MMTRTRIHDNAARAAVVLALLAVWQVPVGLPQGMPSVPVAPTVRPAPVPARATPPVAASPGLPALAPAAQAAAAQPAPPADPFAAISWAPPPPPPPPVPSAAAIAAAAQAPVAPPAPSAPPVPFVYVGMYAEQGRETVMLMKGDQLLLVKQGDTIDNTYRIERVFADRIELTYLPLGMRQSVRTADAA